MDRSRVHGSRVNIRTDHLFLMANEKINANEKQSKLNKLITNWLNDKSKHVYPV